MIKGPKIPRRSHMIMACRRENNDRKGPARIVPKIEPMGANELSRAKVVLSLSISNTFAIGVALLFRTPS